MVTYCDARRNNRRNGGLPLLFVTHHTHTAENCPSADPDMGPMLLRHLSEENTSAAGINIHGDAVVADHNFYLILEAPDLETVQEFMGPFVKVGNVEISEGASCNDVITRRSCGSGRVWAGGRTF